MFRPTTSTAIISPPLLPATEKITTDDQKRTLILHAIQYCLVDNYVQKLHHHQKQQQQASSTTSASQTRSYNISCFSLPRDQLLHKLTELLSPSNVLSLKSPFEIERYMNELEKNNWIGIIHSYCTPANYTFLPGHGSAQYFPDVAKYRKRIYSHLVELPVDDIETDLGVSPRATASSSSLRLASNAVEDDLDFDHTRSDNPHNMYGIQPSVPFPAIGADAQQVTINPWRCGLLDLSPALTNIEPQHEREQKLSLLFPKNPQLLREELCLSRLFHDMKNARARRHYELIPLHIRNTSLFKNSIINKDFLIGEFYAKLQHAVDPRAMNPSLVLNFHTCTPREIEKEIENSNRAHPERLSAALEMPDKHEEKVFNRIMNFTAQGNQMFRYCDIKDRCLRQESSIPQIAPLFDCAIQKLMLTGKVVQLGLKTTIVENVKNSNHGPSTIEKETLLFPVLGVAGKYSAPSHFDKPLHCRATVLSSFAMDLSVMRILGTSSVLSEEDLHVALEGLGWKSIIILRKLVKASRLNRIIIPFKSPSNAGGILLPNNCGGVGDGDCNNNNSSVFYPPFLRKYASSHQTKFEYLACTNVDVVTNNSGLLPLPLPTPTPPSPPGTTNMSTNIIPPSPASSSSDPNDLTLTFYEQLKQLFHEGNPLEKNEIKILMKHHHHYNPPSVIESLLNEILKKGWILQSQVPDPENKNLKKTVITIEESPLPASSSSRTQVVQQTVEEKENNNLFMSQLGVQNKINLTPPPLPSPSSNNNNNRIVLDKNVIRQYEFFFFEHFFFVTDHLFKKNNHMNEILIHGLGDAGKTIIILFFIFKSIGLAETSKLFSSSSSTSPSPPTKREFYSWFENESEFVRRRNNNQTNNNQDRNLPHHHFSTTSDSPSSNAVVPHLLVGEDLEKAKSMYFLDHPSDKGAIEKVCNWLAQNNYLQFIPNYRCFQQQEQQYDNLDDYIDLSDNLKDVFGDHLAAPYLRFLSRHRSNDYPHQSQELQYHHETIRRSRSSPLPNDPHSFINNNNNATFLPSTSSCILFPPPMRMINGLPEWRRKLNSRVLFVPPPFFVVHPPSQQFQQQQPSSSSYYN